MIMPVGYFNLLMHPVVDVAKQLDRRRSISRFSKLSHVIWHCEYHIIWVPKYRYRVLKNKVGYEVMKTIRVLRNGKGYGVVELNVQVRSCPFFEVSISKFMRC